MVKVLKKTLSMALHPGVVLTYPELVILLARISYTINSRPLGLVATSASSNQEDHMTPLDSEHATFRPLIKLLAHIRLQPG